jgi:hypothetical protein
VEVAVVHLGKQVLLALIVVLVVQVLSLSAISQQMLLVKLLLVVHPQHLALTPSVHLLLQEA